VTPKIGGWGFVGGYGEIGFSNIGTPNATFDGGVGVIGGGGVVGGLDIGGRPVEGEAGVLWETGTTLFSVPLGSGTAGQNTNQWTPVTANKYVGVVVGTTEIGALGSCDNQNCTATIFYGQATPPLVKGSLGPVTGKLQLWGGGGLSFTWPSSWWRPL
jgi:hypothetical protein